MKKTSIILLCTLFISIAASAQITKKSVLNQLDTQREKYGAIAMKIWNLAEMGYLEEQSSSLLQQTLSNEGFTIKKGVLMLKQVMHVATIYLEQHLRQQL